MPAHRPDVGIVHAQRADRHGNVQLWGILGVQKEACWPRRARSSPSRRSSTSSSRGPARSCCRRGSSARCALAPRRRAPVVRARLLRARQRLLPSPGTRSAATATRSARGCAHVLSTADSRVPRAARRPAMSVMHRADEMMAVEAARRLARRHGLLRRHRAAEPGREPRASHARAQGCVLVYESGTIGSKPAELPLSIGDGELAETADAVVSVPEMFAYWLQGGRIDVGFLGAAQIDRHGNLNSTVIGDYDAARRCGCRAAAARRRSRSASATSSSCSATRGARSSRSSTSRRASATTCASSSPISACSSRATASSRSSRCIPASSVEQAREATGWDLRLVGRHPRDRTRRPRTSCAPCARCSTKGDGMS